MLAWIKRFKNTPKPSKPVVRSERNERTDRVTMAFIEQSKVLAKLCERQQETLDRIVAAKYDRPVSSPAEAQADNRMPQAMLYDVLGADTDAEFMAKADAMLGVQ